MSDLINSLTVENLGTLMQAAGYRAELMTDPVASVPFLRSATNGLSFDVRMGNRLAGDENLHTDVALVAVFNIVGELPLALVNAWNGSRRFGRLQIDNTVPDQKFLVLCMDVLVAGGVTGQYLRTQIEIWDGLVQQLVSWLRDELGGLQQANGGANSGAAVTAPEAATVVERLDAAIA